MARPPTPGTAALGVRERVLLFCVASGTDWQRAGVTGETVTVLIVRGLLVRDGKGKIALTDDGRAALRALLPGCERLGDRGWCDPRMTRYAASSLATGRTC
ncbi:MAG TPA: hypothetical protein VKC66_10145 [Xanthobacteraceae bacterium]|nr:hypothetical protein [Xanthobacteraceae bacterium]